MAALQAMDAIQPDDLNRALTGYVEWANHLDATNGAELAEFVALKDRPGFAMGVRFAAESLLAALVYGDAIAAMLADDGFGDIGGRA